MLDEVRSGRIAHRFDDAKARDELGYQSRPAVDALELAARRALAPGTDGVEPALSA